MEMLLCYLDRTYNNIQPKKIKRFLIARYFITIYYAPTNQAGNCVQQDECIDVDIQKTVISSGYPQVPGWEVCFDYYYTTTITSAPITPITPITPSLFINKRADNILTSSNEFNHLLYDRNGMHMNKVIILNKHIIIIEGAAGAMHGAAVSGALATTFTASQCLLLMITNLYQFSGELLPGVFHVAARAITKQALSIFGDHQDVMACRQSGVAMLCSNNPQEAQDLAIVAHIATLKSRVPFIHFQDGWRTTSVVHTIKLFTDEQIKALYPYDALETNLRNIGININDANMRGTAQGPDVYFQSLVANNKYYVVSADIVQQTMDDFARVTGREYKLFQYYGSPNAEKVIVMMGSACDTTEVLNKLLMI